MSGVDKNAVSVKPTSSLEHPAKEQITAEKLVSEAYNDRLTPLKTPEYKITDAEELYAYQRRKRQEYEAAIRRNRFNFGQWIRYAQFEISQHDFPRARSILERALDVDSTNVSLWIRYVQIEIKGGNVNHARNLLERATKILPRVDKLWYEYVTVEESLGNVIAVRNIFKQWLPWKPGKDVWRHYIQFEERYKEYDNCRAIFEQYVLVYPVSSVWLSWADFEKLRGDVINIRNVYKLGLQSLSKSHALDAKFLESWARWEATQGKIESSRKLYEFGLKALDTSGKTKLQKLYTAFEKRHGSKASIEKTTFETRKADYESELSKTPTDFDKWWLYFDLISDPTLHLSEDIIRDSFNKALARPPRTHEKHDWLPYMYLWLRYATWEEVHNGNIDGSRGVYKSALSAIPHKKFTFAKLWIKYAQFEIRNGTLKDARLILGQSMGKCPNKKIMSFYISLEIRLKEYDRARKILDKLISSFPEDYDVWLVYVEFEENLGETQRATAIVELALSNEQYLNAEDKEQFLSGISDTIKKGLKVHKEKEESSKLEEEHDDHLKSENVSVQDDIIENTTGTVTPGGDNLLEEPHSNDINTDSSDIKTKLRELRTRFKNRFEA